MFEITNVSNKDQFLQEAKAARMERALERKREQAAITIQVRFSNYTFKCAFLKNQLNAYLLKSKNSH